MALAFKKYYMEDDYYSLPENIRAELIDGKLIYNQAAPSRLHQALLMELAGTIRDYVKSNNGSCRVYPAPFAVKLEEEQDTIVEPDIRVICDKNKLTDRGCTGAPDWICNTSQNRSPGSLQRLRFYTSIFLNHCQSQSLVSSTFTVTLSRCQISSTYCWMVRSEVNLPDLATFSMAIRAQPFSSR